MAVKTGDARRARKVNTAKRALRVFTRRVGTEFSSSPPPYTLTAIVHTSRRRKSISCALTVQQYSRLREKKRAAKRNGACLRRQRHLFLHPPPTLAFLSRFQHSHLPPPHSRAFSTLRFVFPPSLTILHANVLAATFCKYTFTAATTLSKKSKKQKAKRME